jgi:superfamily II DNA or RNA helicase
MTPWAHQMRSVNQALGALDECSRGVVLTIPTGGGKTWCLAEIVKRILPQPVALYTDRVFLRDQIADYLADAGLHFGIRAAGEDDMRELPFQICSTQTEHSRSMKRRSTDLHPAQVVLVDEGHKQTGPTAQAIWERHREMGAKICFSTATPFGMAEVADRLVVGATTSDLRRCGALVVAEQYGPDEPDWKEFKGLSPDQSPTEKQIAKAMSARRMFGSVWEHFNLLNPDRKPTMLFGPDLAGSLYYAQEFSARGVRACHIDGEHIWVDGELHRSTEELREDMKRESKQSKLAVVCNRFVLREGIDMPWIGHGIFATVFGSLQSYLQSGGRLLRACPGIDSVTVQDHGGNWWRHGSLNEDREWKLEFSDEDATRLRHDRIRQGGQKEPFRCPQCGRIWVRCSVCVCGCKLAGRKVARPVVCSDGTLRQMVGPIFRPRHVNKATNGRFLWELMYVRSWRPRGQRTFRQALALYARENRWRWPDRSWPCMPASEYDLGRLVSKVPLERLTSVPDWVRRKIEEIQAKGAAGARDQEMPLV